MSFFCLRGGRQLSALCGASLGFGLACSPEPSLATSRLSNLAVEGAVLSPEFSPETAEYRAEVTLLTHTAVIYAAADAGAGIFLEGESSHGSELEARKPLALGENKFTLHVEGPAGTPADYELVVVRTDDAWHNVQTLLAEEPQEDGYFGDYMRASSKQLYVNSARRGLLYHKAEQSWVFQQRVSELFDIQLDWMFEAAMTETALALVAQPAGGVETLYLFSLTADGAFALSAEHETGVQGTIRIAGDELAFVTPQEVVFFRRSGGAWQQVQQLAAAGASIGFGTRPTYFDAPGVAMSENVLVVSAPFDDSPDTPQVDGYAPCDEATDNCLSDSGSAFVYERNDDGLWEPTAILRASNAAADMQFGQSAAVLGDTIAIGTAREGSSGTGFSPSGTAYDCSPGIELACAPESGAVYLFERVEGSWQPSGVLKASQSRAYDYFGDSVLLSGDTLLVGAPGHDGAFGASADDDTAPDTGGIFVYVRSEGVYNERGIYKLPPDQALPYPFPAQMEAAGQALVVASNDADYKTQDGEILTAAGRVLYLY